jgi:hypothetical protein
MRGAAGAVAVGCVVALAGNAGLASAQLVISSPAGLAPGLRAEVVPQYSEWGRQSLDLNDTEVFLLDKSDNTEYCAMVKEFERSGFINRTLAERARGKVVFQMPEATACEGRFWWDMWVLYPCLFLGRAPIISVFLTRFNFGGFVYSRPVAGWAGYGHISIESFADVTAALHAAMPNVTDGDVTECTLLNMLFINASSDGSGGINSELAPVLDSLRAGESVRVSLHVTESRYKTMWSKPFVRVIFQGVFPVLYVGTTLLALKYFQTRLAIGRKTKGGLKGGKLVQLIVLAVNGCVMLVLGIVLAIDGYGVAGVLSDIVRNYFRPLFLGVASGSDVLLAGLWDATVEDQKLGTASQRKTAFQSKWVFRLALAVMAVDIMSGIASIYLLSGDFAIFMILPLVYLVIRLVIAVHLARSTRKVLSMLTTFAASAMKDNSTSQVAAVQRAVHAQLILIRRLARCINLAVFSSITLCLITLAMGFRLSYFLDDPVPTMWINGVFLLSRWLSSYASVLFCEPPPSAKEIERSVSMAQSFKTKNSKHGSSIAPMSSSVAPKAATSTTS